MDISSEEEESFHSAPEDEGKEGEELSSTGEVEEVDQVEKKELSEEEIKVAVIRHLVAAASYQRSSKVIRMPPLCNVEHTGIKFHSSSLEHYRVGESVVD